MILISMWGQNMTEFVTIIYDEHDIDEIEENPEDFKDDYRTDKEKQADMGDYLRDRAMDRQHELAERDAGAR